jgi:phosphopantothenoylcysteine decarboxylase/phosphopantothenate--cysteine ligase
MGFALAEALAESGSQVLLVSGPTSLRSDHPGIKFFPVHTAREMLAVCMEKFPHTDAAILAAAVADYRPVSPVSHKIKSKNEKLTLELEPNPDIAAMLGKIKKHNQILAGFALETENGISNASEKMGKKNFDFIVLNSLADEGSGFNINTNKITIIFKNNKIVPFELKNKTDVAFDIIYFLDNLMQR